MSVINKTMKTFNVPDGNNTICYEIFDDKGRKAIAKDWASNSSAAYAVGEYVMKDGIVYRFTTAHTAGSSWSSSEVVETNLGAEITGLKSAIGTVPTGKTVQGQIDALENGLEKGTYEDLTAGNALYLLSDHGDTDVAPYVFRKTGGAKNGYGRELLKKIVGGTVAWNQLCPPRSTATVNDVTLTNNGDGTYTLSGTASADGSFDFGNMTRISGHKYLLTGCPSGGGSTKYHFGFNGGIVDEGNGGIQNATSTSTPSIDFTFHSGYAFSNEKFIPQIYDLTQMFGSTIADAIYAMEQATAGSGVAWFRSLFPNSYYAYDAGSLQSVQAKEHRTVGKNLLPMTVAKLKEINTDGTWNGNAFTSHGVVFTILQNGDENVIGIKMNGTSTTGINFYIGVIDFLEGDYIMSDEAGIVTNDFYFYVQYSGGTNNSNRSTSFTISSKIRKMTGIYVLTGKSISNVTLKPMVRKSTASSPFEPYVQHTYPLDSSLTLRGIPKWDSTNGLYYDGDEYKPDGSVKRKYGIVDLGSLTWTYNSENAFFQAGITGIKKDTNDSGGQEIICSKYTYGGYNDSGASMANAPDKAIYKRIYSESVVFIKDTSYTDATTFAAALSGVYLVYLKDTPTTEQTDGYRELQISAHSGTEEFIDAGVTASTPTRDVSIPVGTETFYPIDVVAYIEELTNPDHDMVADALIPSGKYFMVGNSLYKSTSQIQAGDTIIPGSNCTAKNLAEALNELNT